MGMLYEEMIGKGKISLFRNDGGSLWGWMRQYVRGYVMRANPNSHGEFSIEGTADCNESGEAMSLPDKDYGVESAEVWRMTHRCLKDLWNEGPRKAYVLYLRTRMHLSSAEVAEMLDLTEANIDQIFSRSVKQMRANWVKHEKPR
jgi:DNA-directed RNA polymerase specialized sigma subunit